MKNIIGLIISAMVGAAIGFFIGKVTNNNVICCDCCDCGACCPDFVETPEKKPEAKNKEDVILDDVVEEDN